MFYGWEAFQPKYHRDKIEHRCSIRTMPVGLVTNHILLDVN
jgi:hypothetical protein